MLRVLPIAPLFSGASGSHRSNWPLLLLLFPALSLAQTASLEGHVVNALTGEPMRRVTLTLSRMHSGKDPDTAQTDEKGAFSFDGVEPGAYRLRGERNGFLRQEYGARLNPNSGTILVLTRGQALKDLAFRLVPNATLSGRVLDQDGEALPNLLVTAYEYRYANGKRRWQSAGSGQTNDRGEFRISSLRAGRFTVGAANLNLGIGVIATISGALPDKPEPSYADTFLGDASDISQAQGVDLKPGEDRRGADIHLQKVPTVRVRGRVTGAPTGKILAIMAMRKAEISSQSTTGGVAVVQPNENTFELRGLTPGTYRIEARSATEIDSSIGAPAIVEVADEHIEGVELRTGEGPAWEGSIKMAGGSASPKGVFIDVSLMQYSNGPSQHAYAADDGRFSLRGVYPGKYRVMVSILPDNGYVKSIRLGSQEADESTVEWSGSPPPLEILVSLAAGRAEGAVTFPDGKPMRSATVALIPDSGRANRYFTTSSDEQGNFELGHIAPGSYKLIAWEDIEPGAFMDPEFVHRFASEAQAVNIGENSHIKANIQGIPFEKIAGNL